MTRLRKPACLRSTMCGSAAHIRKAAMSFASCSSVASGGTYSADSSTASPSGVKAVYSTSSPRSGGVMAIMPPGKIGFS